MFDSKAYQQALNLLHKASTPFGFVAAVQEHDNYKRVWTRDGVITSIAAMLSGDDILIETAKTTIQTLLNNQHKNGYMPSNVAEDGAVSYGGTCGRADNPSWAVIGLCAYTLLTHDKSLWEKYQPQVENCFAVLEAWEFNGKHLIYVPQSGDWADEYIQHGYILFDQLLRLWALRLASKLALNKSWENKANQITSSIQRNYWKVDGQPNAYAPNLVHQLKDASSNFWLMGFNPARIYKYFDLQANTFAILLGIGNTSQNESVADYMLTLHNKKESLLPSFYPTIEDSDADMNDLKNNYAYNFRNEPNYFHNGGLWPVWNGWAVGALKIQGKNKLAEGMLKAIHQSNGNQDLFNECLHGETEKPCGVPNCTWSAAGAIIAEQAWINIDFKKLFQF
ncbi:glycoside hydrolase 100 family protein [Pedobacter lithocola]|uniref:beta-fructofuranosidase n=1 Tax=Pedobacter lithocola TaxID=1908239 RepID=A0ABV8P6J6_9SPHI